MQAVILAGGKGTRLRPLTFNIPKPLLPLVNKPILAYQIEQLIKHNIKEIVLCLNYQADLIKKYFLEAKFGVKIKYSLEENPLGTAGAVKNAEKYLKDEDIIILNGDTLTDLNLSKLIKFHKKNKSLATLFLTKVEDVSMYGLVLFDKRNRITAFLEKPGFDERPDTNTINAGIYVLKRKVLEHIPKDREYSFERELYPSMIEKKLPLFTFLSSSYWMDIGTPKKYQQACFDILTGKVKVKDSFKKILGEVYTISNNIDVHPDAKLSNCVYLGKNVKIKKGVEIIGPAIISDYCEIQEDCLIRESIVLNGCKVEKGCKINNCILGENSVLKKNSLLEKGIVLGHNSIINNGIGVI